MSSKFVTKSRHFSEVSDRRVEDVETVKGSLAGVRVRERGNKKGREVEVLIPISDKKNVRLTLTGRQAFSIYNTLNRHYERKLDGE